ncbi:unnamed protein product [Mortierella alpina]
MNNYRGGHGRGGPGGAQHRGAGGPGGMAMQGDMAQQQQFGFQQRGFPPQMMPHPQQGQQPGPPLPPQPQQQQQMGMVPQQIHIPSNQQNSRSFMSGMPSPSLSQPTAMPSMGYPGAGSGSGMARTPFGPPLSTADQGQKSHHEILRKHQEEYALKQSGQVAMSQAHSTTPGTYMGLSSKHQCSIVPILPRMPNPYE